MEKKKSWLNLSYIDITPDLSIKIPTVGNILENENAYYSIISSLTATPFQYMVLLDDMGIDYTTIDEWQLFCMLFTNYSNQELLYKTKLKELEKEKNQLTPNSIPYKECEKQIHFFTKELENNGFQIIFHNLKLTDEMNGKLVGFHTYHEQNGTETILYNPATKVEINRLIYNDLTDAIRKINFLEKIKSKPGNDTAKKYLLQKERKKQQRTAKKAYEPYLEKLVIALVNTSEFPYDYDSCMNLSIYRFHHSFKQIQQKIAFDNTMIGVYAGTIDTSKITNKNNLSWIQIG